MLARSHATQDSVAAFITITDEGALTAARQADADLAAGIDKGPLQGIPLAVKDIITTADAPTTANSNLLDRSWGERGDAPVVRRLRDAGAILTGKLGLNEHAIGWPNPAVMLTNPSFTGIWNLTGFPALSVNCGFTEGGLPIGMQIIGRPFDEPAVFKAGDAYQMITDWHTRRPALEVKEATPA